MRVQHGFPDEGDMVSKSANALDLVLRRWTNSDKQTLAIALTSLLNLFHRAAFTRVGKEHPDTLTSIAWQQC
jgi:hypothetical protein